MKEVSQKRNKSTI